MQPKAPLTPARIRPRDGFRQAGKAKARGLWPGAGTAGSGPQAAGRLQAALRSGPSIRDPRLDRMTKHSRRNCAVLVGLLVLRGSLFGAGQEPAGDFQLSLMRHYGRHIFLDCRVDVTMFQGTAVASLHCDHSGKDANGRPIPPLRSREELSKEDSRRLADLVRASALYDGGHIGKDDTEPDGAFEVLKLRSNGRAVMVVTSGNPTFEQDKPRRALLSLLRAVEKRLADAGSKRT